MSTGGLVWMLAVVGTKNSQNVLLAIASKTGVRLLLRLLSSNTKIDTLLSFSLVFLVGLSMKFVESPKPYIYYPANNIYRWTIPTVVQKSSKLAVELFYWWFQLKNACEEKSAELRLENYFHWQSVFLRKPPVEMVHFHRQFS
jgi:hypothetical protein